MQLRKQVAFGQQVRCGVFAFTHQFFVEAFKALFQLTTGRTGIQRQRRQAEKQKSGNQIACMHCGSMREFCLFGKGAHMAQAVCSPSFRQVRAVTLEGARGGGYSARIMAKPPSSLSSACRVALVIPCHNEALTIGSMVRQARKLMPQMEVVVCDNASRDATAQEAAKAGAVVLHEHRRGKAYAVQRLFNAVDADVYVMMDGDATYEMAALPRLVDMLRQQRLAMVVGARVDTAAACYRRNHRWGNWVFNTALRVLFGSTFRDVFSGYRVFSRGFVKSFPIGCDGFTIESAMTVHALHLRAACAEVDTLYAARPEGSVSKLSTWKDGWRILMYLVGMFAHERPLAFYGGAALLMLAAGATLFVPVLLTYLDTGLVPRYPTLLVAGCLGVAAVVCGVAGMIMQAVAHGRTEAKQLAYLAAER